MEKIDGVLRNVNVTKKLSNNVNDNVGGKTGKKDAKFVDDQAHRMVERLNDPDSLNYYRTIYWKLSDAKIERNLEQALKGRNPKRYFTFLCNLDMGL